MNNNAAAAQQIAALQLESKQKAASGRRELAEGVAELFEAYIANWGRLRAIATTVAQEQNVTAEREQQVASLAAQRNQTRDLLFRALARAQLQFGDNVAKQISEFKAWDTEYSVTELPGLPPQRKWAEQRDSLLTAMKSEIQSGESR